MSTNHFACFVTISTIVGSQTIRVEHHIGTIRTRSGYAPSIETITRKARRQGEKGRIVGVRSSPVAGGKP